MSRRSLLPVLLISATLSACQPSAPDPRGVARDETLLTVSATGRAETRPDEARFMVGVATLAPSAGEASRLNNEKMARVTTALTRFGIKPDDLQTTNLTLNRIDYGKDRGRFQASNNVTVRLKDLTQGQRRDPRHHRGRRQPPVGPDAARRRCREGRAVGLCRRLQGRPRPRRCLCRRGGAQGRPHPRHPRRRAGRGRTDADGRWTRG